MGVFGAKNDKILLKNNILGDAKYPSSATKTKPSRYLLAPLWRKIETFAPGAPKFHTRAGYFAGNRKGFFVAIRGDIMVMPGLPRKLAALEFGLDSCDQIVSLA